MMTFPAVFSIFIFSFIVILFVRTSQRRRGSSLPTDWPLLGMLPGMIRNSYRLHDYATEIVAESDGTFQWRGPSLCNMDMLITSNPANIHHILSRNFSIYPKGPEFNKIFEILGDGIFNADFHIWELHRRTTMSFLTSPKFYALLKNSVWQKVENGLIPVLDHFCQTGKHPDLQDVFQRLTFDTICSLVLDCDPRSLCVDMPYVPCEKAFNDAIDALLYRHLLPEGVWQLQKLFRIGKEKKLIEASKAFDDFIYPCIDLSMQGKDDDFNLLASFKKEFDQDQNINGSLTNHDSRKFLRDTALSLMLAGRDTTSATLTWLFWLITQNPSSENKIRREIEAELDEDKRRCFDVQDSKKLVYLHGALCESLRLYPPVALEHKAPIRPDYLPSGNEIKKDGKVIISFYSVGRMESVWGKDCLEFKPERWITEKGGIKHEPSYKFPAFNAGPRTCLGKEMAFVQMKMVAATIIYRYDVRVVEGDAVLPRDSIILQTKNGLRVKLCKREVFDHVKQEY